MTHRRIADSISSLALGVILALCLAWLAQQGYRIWLNQQPPNRWFEYESVEYLHTNNDGTLEFESIAAWHRPIDKVTWVDQLQCTSPTGQWQRFSQQSLTAEEGREPVGPSITQWPYTATAPPERTCRLQATITAGVGQGVTKQQIVYSAPFDT